MSSAIGILLSIAKCFSEYDTRVTMGIYPQADEEYLCRIADISKTECVDRGHNAGDKADFFQRKQMNMFTLVDCEMLNKNISNQKVYSNSLIHMIMTSIVCARWSNAFYI